VIDDQKTLDEEIGVLSQSVFILFWLGTMGVVQALSRCDRESAVVFGPKVEIGAHVHPIALEIRIRSIENWAGRLVLSTTNKLFRS